MRVKPLDFCTVLSTESILGIKVNNPSQHIVDCSTKKNIRYSIMLTVINCDEAVKEAVNFVGIAK